MQVLTEEEIDMVSGGDSWAGTPEGRAAWEPSPDTWLGCMISPDTVKASQANAVIAAMICGESSCSNMQARTGKHLIQ